MAGTELKGPGHCAECGTDIRSDRAEDWDAGPLVFTIEEHRITVPGLYVCTPCAGAIMVGERESGVTLGDAAEFLAGVFIPSCMVFMATHDGDDFERACARLDEAVKVGEILALASLLGAMEDAADEEGCDPEDLAIVVIEMPSDPRGMATFN